MSEEKKDGLAQSGEVESVNIKVDASELKEVATTMKESIETLKEVVEKTIPGPAAADMSEKDKRDLSKYKISNAILKFAKGKLDGLEAEMHQEAEKEMRDAGGLSLSGLGVPTIATRADLKATVAAQGGYTVATDLKGFIETLRNQMVSLRAGAQLWTGMQGDVAIPKRSADSTAYWRTEGGLAKQSDPTYTQVTMTPHRLTAYTEFTQQLLKQSTLDVEAEVRNVLFYSMANALETAFYAGSGTSQVPQGLVNVSGVNDADHGSNGTIMSWNNIVQMEKMVATDNALAGKLAYVTNATLAGKMKTTLKNTYQGGWIWEQFTPLNEGMVNGYPAYITNAISNTTTRGTNSNTSLLIFGDFSQAIIGQWGSALDLLVNPYSLDTYGTIRVIVAGYYDIAVKQPSAFAVMAGAEN